MLCLYTYSTFMGNSGGNGIVSLGYSPVKFSGTNLFVGNLGAAVRVCALFNVKTLV